MTSPIIQGRLVSHALPGVLPQFAPQMTLVASTPTQVLGITPTLVAKQGLTLQAASFNTASVWFGLSNVSDTNGMELVPGEAVSISVQDPSVVYLYAIASGQKVNIGWL